MPRGQEENAGTRAKAVLAVLEGEKLKDVAARFGIARTTLSGWMKEFRGIVPVETQGITAPPAQIRREAFEREVFELVADSMKMLRAIVAVCQKEDFIREKPEDVERLGRFVFDRLDRVIGGVVRDPETPSDSQEAE
jgi:transposase-like protein